MMTMSPLSSESKSTFRLINNIRKHKSQHFQLLATTAAYSMLPVFKSKQKKIFYIREEWGKTQLNFETIKLRFSTCLCSSPDPSPYSSCPSHFCTPAPSGTSTHSTTYVSARRTSLPLARMETPGTNSCLSSPPRFLRQVLPLDRALRN